MNWEFTWPVPENINVPAHKANRGVAILGETLYLGTLDAHLVALDARTGQQKWAVQVADYRQYYSITAAPLIVKDMVITGAAGGVFDTRGFINAYDANTGELRWRFYTVPGTGEPGNETWEGDSWKVGGAAAWLTGTYDSALDLIYWGVGNPNPPWTGDRRKGDNLYSASVVALHASTGKLKWYYQFTPHDVHDWDACQIPVLVDLRFSGTERKLLLMANRNAFFYVLDRENGELLLAQEYARQNWADGIDANGRPIVRPNTAPSYEGSLVSPTAGGGTSWWSPSFSPNTGLFYVTARDGEEIYKVPKVEKWPTQEERLKIMEKSTRQINQENELSTVRALVPETGELKWEFKLPRKSTAGVLTTAGDILFAGSATSEFWALDAFTGIPLWRSQIQGWIHTAPITYMSEGSQFVTIASSKGIYTFGLGNEADFREDKWQLSTQEGSRAHLVFPPDNLQMVRIAIEKAETDVPWHIQLSQPHLSVKSGQRYAVRFRARADGPRSVTLGFSQAHPPWEGLGLYKKLELTSAWQSFDMAFVTTSDEDNARIRFDLGGSDISVEVSDVSLQITQ